MNTTQAWIDTYKAACAQVGIVPTEKQAAPVDTRSHDQKLADQVTENGRALCEATSADRAEMLAWQVTGDLERLAENGSIELPGDWFVYRRPVALGGGFIVAGPGQVKADTVQTAHGVVELMAGAR